MTPARLPLCQSGMLASSLYAAPRRDPTAGAAWGAAWVSARRATAGRLLLTCRCTRVVCCCCCTGASTCCRWGCCWHEPASIGCRWTLHCCCWPCQALVVLCMHSCCIWQHQAGWSFGYPSQSDRYLKCKQNAAQHSCCAAGLRVAQQTAPAWPSNGSGCPPTRTLSQA